MTKKHKNCENKVKKIDQFTDLYWGRFKVYYCKHCKKIVNELEISL